MASKSVATMSVTVDGLPAVLARLRRLERVSTRRRILRESMRLALTPVLNKAKVEVPVDTTTLKRSLGRRIRTYTRTGAVVGLVGPRRKMGRSIIWKQRKSGKWYKKLVRGKNFYAVRYLLPTKYAHLVEFGTVRSRANPFLQRAWLLSKARFLQILRKEVWERVKREAVRK